MSVGHIPEDRHRDGMVLEMTVAENIAYGLRMKHVPKQEIKKRVKAALERVNMTQYAHHGPHLLSGGQKQRILIARAVYKDPEFIFLDEATNALDTNNEKEIMEHLHRFYRGRTVVVVAHRLSTVRDADNIVVLDKGRVAEEGTHEELTAKRGIYYKLVKNQLELGN